MINVYSLGTMLTRKMKRLLRIKDRVRLCDTPCTTFAILLAAWPLMTFAALNDTGITTCASETETGLPCPVPDFPGQDAEYGSNGFNFTKLDANGRDLPADAIEPVCVRDNITGLIWEVKTNDNGLRDDSWYYSWYDAEQNLGAPDEGRCFSEGRCDTAKYVEDVNAVALCGFNDWRLPNPTELVGISDYAPYTKDIYGNIQYDEKRHTYLWRWNSDYFWSSHLDSTNVYDHAVYVWPGGGGVGTVPVYSGYKVLLVRGTPAAANIFVHNGDSTVSQVNAGLMWSTCPVGRVESIDQSTGIHSCHLFEGGIITSIGRTWQQALNAARESRLGGYNDWRIPNVKELQSLWDYHTNYDTVDETFFPMSSYFGYFWSSSASMGDSGNGEIIAYALNFSGFQAWLIPPDEGLFAVRFVRDIQAAPTLFSLNVRTMGSGSVTSTPPGIDCGTDCSEAFAAGTAVTLTATPAANWSFSGWGGACTGTADCVLTIAAPTDVTANFAATNNRYQLDSPVNGSFESGIGVVHGWVCEAEQVSVRVDDRAPFAMAYGAERADSQDVCSDTANGFAAAINWADYGDGEHTLSLLADGQPLTEARVTVTTLGKPFLTGLSAATTVADFPALALSTPLAWSEPHQNFVVSTASAAAAGAALVTSATSQSHWESPLAGGVESGQALIRGWTCAAGTIRAELDGTSLTLPYGSEREDTRPLCGDTDNGYALAINWNDYGDGPHQMRLLLDDVPVETRAFQIATPGGQGTVSGVQRQHAIADFPNPGDQLTLQWSEPHQNFRIIAYSAATGPTPQSYHRKVRAYFYGVLGRAPDTEELDAWSRVLLDNKGSVWKPTGDGLQRHLSDLAGWGAETPTDAEARALVDTVLAQLFGAASGLDRRIPDYYVRQLVEARLRPRGFVNAVLNDLGLMPRADGSYGKPADWTGGPGAGLLTQAQIDAYRARIEAED
jgi:hypothetical protein